jgi:hypothetical protein
MLSLTRIVLGQAGDVVGDAAHGFAEGEATAQTKVGQESTASVSTIDLINSRIHQRSVAGLLHPAPFALQRAETRLHSTNLSTVLGDRAHLQ